MKKISTRKKNVYERTVSECKKLRYLIDNVVRVNLNVLFRIKCDNVRIENGIIFNKSVIPKYSTEICE